MFHKEHFCHVSSTNRGCPQYSIYVYKTTDSVETMLSAGYFNGALLDLHKNDVILAGIISDIDDGQYSTAWFRVIKRSLDAIEVEQVLTSADNITYDGTGTNYLSQFDNVQDAISALDAELKKESTERTQGQESLQGQIDGINEKIPETASASNQLATESDINTLQGQIDDNSKDIEALQGAGGALTAYNFNTATPTQETLTKYAVDQIWPGNTNWAWNAANPAASTFTDANGVARTAAEIFNSTWVNNTYDDHRWQLTNTQNTAPKVFEWADVGRDIVSVATATTAGIVRVGSGSQMVVNASTGDISLDGTKAESIRGTIGAVASNQGSSNSGLILGIDASGNVVPTESSSGGRNIGDIFWTTRTDSALNGAVEANGAQYNFADVNGGANNVQALLASGALPSVSIAKFDAMVAKQGGCDSFGYGTDTLWTRWSKVQQEKDFVYTETESYEVGDPVYDVPGGNIIGNITETGTGWPMTYTDTNGVAYSTEFVGYVSGPVDSTPYFKVPKKLGRVLVRSQKPTEDNNYTWYNVYSDGWVEQGGNATVANAGTGFTLPIEMSDANYTIVGGKHGDDTDGIGFNITPSTTTQFVAGVAYPKPLTRQFSWQVSGYANSAEYTPDKWDYQNVQVERPMVQLFNGATDEAVAKCTEVLSDVAGLKLNKADTDLSNVSSNIDYVVESQEPTSGNGYTWYRKYKSGWVEQGGFCSGTAEDNPVTLAIEMKDTEYTIVAMNMQTTAVDAWGWVKVTTDSQTTTGFSLSGRQGSGSVTPVRTHWQVSGMSAQ